MRCSFSVSKRQYARIPLLLRSVGVDHLQEPILRPNGFPVWQIFFGVSGVKPSLASLPRAPALTYQLVENTASIP